MLRCACWHVNTRPLPPTPASLLPSPHTHTHTARYTHFYSCRTRRLRILLSRRPLAEETGNNCDSLRTRRWAKVTCDRGTFSPCVQAKDKTSRLSQEKKAGNQKERTIWHGNYFFIQPVCNYSLAKNDVVVLHRRGFQRETRQRLQLSFRLAVYMCAFSLESRQKRATEMEIFQLQKNYLHFKKILNQIIKMQDFGWWWNKPMSLESANLSIQPMAIVLWAHNTSWHLFIATKKNPLTLNVEWRI